MKSPLKNIKLKQVKSSIERLVVELSAEDENGHKIIRTLEFVGNATTANYSGAVLIVETLNDMAS